MKLQFPVKEKIMIGDLYIAPCYGSFSQYEIEKWNALVKRLDEKDRSVRDHYVAALEILAARLDKSPIAEIDWDDIPETVIEGAYAFVLKERKRWAEATPEPVVAEKKQTGKRSTTDSTKTTPISGIEIDLLTPQST